MTLYPNSSALAPLSSRFSPQRPFPRRTNPFPSASYDLALPRTAHRGTTRLLVHNISSYNVRSFQFDAQEEELIFGIHRPFTLGTASRAPLAAAILAACAILAPASKAQ